MSTIIYSVFVLCFLLIPLGSIYVLLYAILYTQYYKWAIVWCLWCLYDRNTKTQIRRRSEWFRKLPIWNCLRDYFPSALVKTVDLDPKENYIIALHPHGIIVAGGFNFATEAGGFSEKFPGIKPFFLVHEIFLMFNFLRMVAIYSGVSSVKKESFEYLLREREGGTAVVLLPGGVREMTVARPGKEVHVFLRNRKGFVREAIKHGASLVPAFTFNEHELFNVVQFPDGGWLQKFQTLVNDYIHLPFMIFWGRLGILPYQKPITTVVGAPIPCERNLNPDQDEVDMLHAKYMAHLTDLFEEHKSKYADKDSVLKIL